MKIFFAVLTFLLVFQVTAEEEKKEKTIIAVTEIEDSNGSLARKTGQKQSKEMLQRATEYMRGKFTSSNMFSVVPKDRQQKEISSLRKKYNTDPRYKGCSDQSCRIQLGQALSAEMVLSTTIVYFGNDYSIRSELINLETELSEKGGEAAFDGSEKGLKEAIDSIVAQIIGTRRGRKGGMPGQFGGRKDNWEVGGVDEVIIKFGCNPAGAAVIVDGQMICQTTPCDKSLKKGEHEIEMQKENYLPLVKKVKIFKETKIEYRLEADFALLTVSGKHEAELKLDGKKIGRIPVKEKMIAPGDHKIEVDDRCFFNSGENFTVKRGEKKQITLKTDPRESAVKVRAKDEKGNDLKADVWVDDRLVGKTPDLFKVPLCSKVLKIKAEGKKDFVENLSLKERKEKELNAKLESLQPAQDENGAEAESSQEKPLPEGKRSQDKETYRPYKALGISLAAIGAAVVVGGVTAFHVLSDREYGRYKDMNDFKAAADAKAENMTEAEYLEKADNHRKKAKTFRGLEITAGILGGSLVIGGTVLALIKKEKNSDVVLQTVSVVPSDDGFYAALGFGF